MPCGLGDVKQLSQRKARGTVSRQSLTMAALPACAGRGRDSAVNKLTFMESAT